MNKKEWKRKLDENNNNDLGMIMNMDDPAMKENLGISAQLLTMLQTRGK